MFWAASQSSPLSAGPQAAVPMSFQLVMPPILLRRHDRPGRARRRERARIYGTQCAGTSFSGRITAPLLVGLGMPVMSSFEPMRLARDRGTERIKNIRGANPFEDQ